MLPCSSTYGIGFLSLLELEQTAIAVVITLFLLLE